MSSLDFIKQIGSGELTKATETLQSLLATTAYEKLEDRKEELAHKIFNQQVEEGIDRNSKIYQNVRNRYGDKNEAELLRIAGDTINKNLKRKIVVKK